MSQRAEMIKARLLNGECIERYKEAGNSMVPILKSRQPVDLSPVDEATELVPGKSIVFCKVKGNFYTHKVTGRKVKNGKEMFQISNNHKYVNGWIPRSKIYGIVTRIWES